MVCGLFTMAREGTATVEGGQLLHERYDNRNKSSLIMLKCKRYVCLYMWGFNDLFLGVTILSFCE